MGNMASASPPQNTFISTGMSSYSNGDEVSGTHSFTNVNGDVQHETTGNLPTGFFSNLYQGAATPGLTAVLLMTLAAMSMSVVIIIGLVKLRNATKARGHSVKRTRGPVCDGYAYNDRIFPLSNKRPLAEALWNSDLLLEELVIDDKVQPLNVGL